jgi:hypothetical protein
MRRAPPRPLRRGPGSPPKPPAGRPPRAPCEGVGVWISYPPGTASRQGRIGGTPVPCPDTGRVDTSRRPESTAMRSARSPAGRSPDGTTASPAITSATRSSARRTRAATTPAERGPSGLRSPRGRVRRDLGGDTCGCNAGGIGISNALTLARRKRRVGSRAAEWREADPLLAPGRVCDRAAGVHGVRSWPRSRARRRARARCAHIARSVTQAARQPLHATERVPAWAPASGLTWALLRAVETPSRYRSSNYRGGTGCEPGARCQRA